MWEKIYMVLKFTVVRLQDAFDHQPFPREGVEDKLQRFKKDLKNHLIPYFGKSSYPKLALGGI